MNDTTWIRGDEVKVGDRVVILGEPRSQITATEVLAVSKHGEKSACMHLHGNTLIVRNEDYVLIMAIHPYPRNHHNFLES